MRFSRLAAYAAFVLVVYLAIALNVYALRHPELTRTQVLLDVVDAALWR